MRNKDVCDVVDRLQCSVNQAIYLLMLSQENVQTAIRLFEDGGLQRYQQNYHVLATMRTHPSAKVCLSGASDELKSTPIYGTYRQTVLKPSVFFYNNYQTQLAITPNTTSQSVLRILRRKWPNVGVLLVDGRAVDGNLYAYRNMAFICY